MPPNIWNTLRNDSDPVAQNERILKLFLQLAMHAANHLTHLRKETDKGYDCNKRNDSLSISTTEALITQLPSQADLEWLDKSKKMNYSSSDDFEKNVDQNQTASLNHSQLQELFDPGDFQNINNQNVIHNLSSKLTNLIPKSVQDTSSDTTEDNHEALNDILQKSILDLDTTSNPLNTSKFRSDSRKSARDDINEKLLNQIDLKNTSVTNDLTKTVNKFLPKSQTLQESTFGISQRLFGTDLAQIVPKITSNVHKNTNQYIPSQNTEKPSDGIDDINQRFLNPVIIKNSGNILSRQVAYNLSVVKQILSSMENIMESMIKVLSEAAKSASNLPNQIISGFQNTINRLLKIAEEGRKYLAHFDYTQQEQSKTAKEIGNQFNDLLHNRQDLTNNTESNIREAVNASGKNNLNTTANDLPINDDNSTEINNKQYVSTLLKDSSTPLFRLLPDFNKHSSKIETALSSIQTNDNANSFTKEKQSINDHKKIDQIDEEIRAKGFKRMNETRMDYSDEQLNPISEDLSQKSKESALTEVAVTTSTFLNQLESNTFTIMEQAKSLGETQDSGNVSNIIKSDLEKIKRLQDNPSANNGNQSIENQVTHINNPLQSNSSFIDDLKDENLHKQLSGIKLQETSDQLINAFWPIMEKRMANNRSYVSDHYNKWNKNLSSNMLSNSTIN